MHVNLGVRLVEVHVRRTGNVKNLARKYSNLLRDKGYINGCWVQADSGKTFPVQNPANGALIGNVPDMGVAETQRAIDVAHKSFYQWKTKTAKERSVILHKWGELIIKNHEDLGKLLTAEMGKPLKDAIGEVLYGAEFVHWFAGEARRVYGDVIQSADPKKRIITLKQPVGVAATITPWNFPVAMVTRKVAPAVAAGCTVVLKPAEDTPLCSLALCQLAEEAGFPPGILNCVTSSYENTPLVGRTLCESPLVGALSFTGSTDTGKLLIKQCADTVKKLSMELGGNAPFIVFESADIEAAAQAALMCKFRSSGQTCVCANRFLVQESVHEEFVQRFAALVDGLTLGDGLETGVTQGPLINMKAVKKIEGLVQDATSQGAKVVSGGARRLLSGGSFFQPTLLTEVTTEMKCMQQEIFGNVAPIIKFKTEEEALSIANSTNYGLAGYIFSQNLNQVWRVLEQLEVGMVGINEGLITFAVSEAPLGGVKESGLGREGSKYGMDEYLEVKYVCFGNVQ